MKLLRPAFTFFEIMVVLFLIGMVATILVPFMTRRPIKTEWRTILDDMNTMALFARQEAIANKKVYRLVFKSNSNAPDMLWVEEENPDPEKPGHLIYTAVSSYYFDTKYQFAEQVKLQSIKLGKEDLLSEHLIAYCYIVPDGLIQDIVVKLVRRIEGVEANATFKMNPFLGRFDFIEVGATG